MSESNFRNSSLEELYGPSRFNEPNPPGRVDWKPIVIHAAITAAIIVIPVVTIVVIQNSLHAKKMETMRNEYEEKLQRLAERQQTSETSQEENLI